MTRHDTSRLFGRKNAVSPLIATVLLIAFAVALGAVVMNWGRGYVEDTANIARERSDTEVKCASDVDVSIVEIDNVAQVCYNTTGDTGDANNGTIDFIVENKKSTTIEKIQARLIGEATRVPYIVDLGDNSNLSTNQAKYLNMSYKRDTYGIPQQLKLTPYIKVGGSEVSCPASGEITTNIKPCAEIFT
jgi:flagellin-like protein